MDEKKTLNEWGSQYGIKIISANGFNKEDPTLWEEEFTLQEYVSGIAKSSIVCQSKVMAALMAVTRGMTDQIKRESRKNELVEKYWMLRFSGEWAKSRQVLNDLQLEKFIRSDDPLIVHFNREYKIHRGIDE